MIVRMRRLVPFAARVGRPRVYAMSTITILHAVIELNKFLKLRIFSKINNKINYDYKKSKKKLHSCLWN